MRKSAVVAAVLALGMGFSAVAQAQPHGDHRRGPPPPPHAQGHYQGPPPGHAKKHHDMRRHGPDRRDHGPRAHYRGAGPEHRWVQGYRLPPQYRARQYVVNDWRAHRLAPPPRGHQWVQYGGDYMLVAIASGVITQLILHNLR